MTDWDEYNKSGEEFFNAKNYAEAEKFWKKALVAARGKERTFVGEKNYNTSLKNLSRLYYERGIWEPGDKEVMMFTTILGKRISDALSRGRLIEAEELSIGLLRIRQKALVPDDRSIFGTRATLGDVKVNLGKYDDAQKLYKENLELAERIAGPMGSFLTILSIKDLSRVQIMLGDYQEAEPMLKKGLQLCEQNINNMPLLLPFLSRLAAVYWQQGRFTEAQPLFERSLQLVDKTEEFGVLVRAVEFYIDQSRFAEAEAFCKRALEQLDSQKKLLESASANADSKKVNDRLRLLNKIDAARAVILGKYSGCLRKTQKASEAIQLEAQAESIARTCLQKFDQDGLEIAALSGILAGISIERQDFENTERLLQQSLAIYQRRLGFYDVESDQAVDRLAAFYVSQKQYKKAEPLYEQSLHIKEKLLGVNHPGIKSSLDNYAMVLEKGDRSIEARNVRERARLIGAH